MLAWPLTPHVITRRFDYESDLYVGGMHAALDIASSLGTPIKTVAGGIVIGDSWDLYSGYFIGVQHPDGWVSFYRHLRTDAPPVKGQSVVQGQAIGYVGSTGLSEGPHLHFDLWHKVKQDPTAFYKNGWWAHNPELYLGKEEEDEMLRLIQSPVVSADVYITDGAHKSRASSPRGIYIADLLRLGLLKSTTPEAVSRATFDRLKEW